MSVDLERVLSEYQHEEAEQHHRRQQRCDRNRYASAAWPNRPERAKHRLFFPILSDYARQ